MRLTRGRDTIAAKRVVRFERGDHEDIQELSVHVASNASEPRFVRLWVSYQSRSRVDKTGCGILPECGHSEAGPAD